MVNESKEWSIRYSAAIPVEAEKTKDYWEKLTGYKIRVELEGGVTKFIINEEGKKPVKIT